MKIYRSITIQISSGQVLAEDAYDYDGPLAEAKGGSSSTTTVDRAYNARMAAVSEAQLGIAQEYQDFWKSVEAPYSKATMDANLKLLPAQTEDTLADLQSKGVLRPLETEASKAKLGLETATATSGLQLLPQQTALAAKKIGASSQAIDLARQGVDGNAAMSMAGADVAQAFAKAREGNKMSLARRFASPNSTALASLTASSALEQAKAVGQARTQARDSARDKSFAMLQQVTGGA